MDDNTTVGVRLKELRNAQKLTQEELAQSLGISNVMISSYECGTRFPSIALIIKIAEFFQVTTDSLLGLPDNHISFLGLSDDEISALMLTAEIFKRNRLNSAIHD